MAKKVLIKKCNVTTKGDVIVTSSRRIVGSLKETYLTVGEIVQCLQRKAFVEEILEDGSTIQLTIMNYDKDNNANIRAKMAKEGKLEAPKAVEPNKVEVPVDVVKDVLENKVDTSNEVINPFDLKPVEMVVEDVTPVLETAVGEDVTEEVEPVLVGEAVQEEVALECNVTVTEEPEMTEEELIALIEAEEAAAREIEE